jgi:hypothetical protein
MSSYKIIVKDLFLDTLWEIFYFPIWWYSRGLKKTAFFCWQKIRDGWRSLALSIFLKSFFKPMYGQRGWDAYFLSLFARFWQVGWRFILMALWAMIWFFVLLTWMALPVFVIWQLMI